MRKVSEETRRRMSESAKRRCTPEWRAKQSRRLSVCVDETRLLELYASGMTQDEVARVLGVSQKVVWGRMRRLGIEARVAAKRNQAGVLNSSWKGGAALYAACHLRVQAARGKPSLCEHCGTTHGRFQWASLTKNYTDVNDYVRLCRSCHAKMDGVISNIVRAGSRAKGGSP